jgi:methyl-accepting chemotaxis protein
MALRLLRKTAPALSGRSSSLSDIGDRAGKLGVAIADVAGLIGDLTVLGQTQSRCAQGAMAAAHEMAQTNTILSAAMASARQSADATQATLQESAGQVSTALTGAVEKIGTLGDGAIALKESIERVAETIRRVQETSGAPTTPNSWRSTPPSKHRTPAPPARDLP